MIDYKQQIYQNWIAKGRPWYALDKSKEPTAEERNIILDILQKENRIKSKAASTRPKNEIKAFERLIRNYY